MYAAVKDVCSNANLPGVSAVPDLPTVHAPHHRTNQSQLRVRCSSTLTALLFESMHVQTTYNWHTVITKVPCVAL